MVSHGYVGNIKIGLGKRGLFIAKKPNRYNNCIADKLRGKKTGSRQATKVDFTSAAKSCSK